MGIDVRTLRQILVWVFTLLALVSLAFGSFVAGIDWVTAGGRNDGEFFAWSWPPTMVAVWAFGSAGLVMDGRLRLLAPYLLVAVGAFLAILFMHAVVLTEPSGIGPLLLLSLNCGAVCLAWRVLFPMHLSALLVRLFTLLALASLAAGSLLLSVIWFFATSTSNWEFAVLVFGTPTTVVASVLGAAAFLAAGRLRMLVPYLAVSVPIFYISWIMLIFVTGTSLFSPLLLITVNCVAIYLPWEELLRGRPAADAQAGRA